MKLGLEYVKISSEYIVEDESTMEIIHKHQLIKEYLIDRIKNKELMPFDMIESENELAEKFKVSRMTSRKVIDELVVLGFLYREHGKGTFVSDLPRFKDLQSFLCFTEEAALKGLAVENRIVEFYLDLPTPAVRNKLGISMNTKVWYIRRVRCVDNQTYAYEDAAFLLSVFKDCNEQILKGSIYHHLENTLGINISFANQEIEAVVADKKMAELLEISEGVPLLKISMVSYLKNGLPFEYTTTYYRSDRFKVSQSAFRTRNR
jgi:GntR family transcriptional regulator